MNLPEFAETVLYGSRLEDKLISPKQLEMKTSLALCNAPPFPGRPTELARPGKSVFPAIESLHKERVRGEILHFFANHELLALELMALALLRFPDAPNEFRLGLVKTIQDEQRHLQLYLDRMKELGVEFGELPVSDYFWKAVSPSRTALEFVTQMSLTLEQANLDFAWSFKQAFDEIGDTKTSAILERVFLDEIGHVKHGLGWFNRWRENATTEPEWRAYLRLLPPPMTPKRAKGDHFNDDARRKAGLSEDFIRELKLYSGTKGRAPVVWIYNPACELEIARGRPGFSFTEGAKETSVDLEHLPLFLASDQDLILTDRLPSADWLEKLRSVGIIAPVFALKRERLTSSIRDPKVGGIEPWGWSPEIIHVLKGVEERLVQVGGGNSEWCKRILSQANAPSGFWRLFSKSWSTRFFNEWLLKNPGSSFNACASTIGSIAASWEEARATVSRMIGQFGRVAVKAPYGTSGIQVRQIRSMDELDSPLGGWIKNTIATQHEILIEPWLEKTADLSVQLVVEDRKTRILGGRRFVNGGRNEYHGTYLGQNLAGLEKPELRCVQESWQEWQELLRAIGEALRTNGYLGPAGVDAMTWKDSGGVLRLKPMVEINPRWTMGRVALELERLIAPGSNGFWRLVPMREIRDAGFSSAIEYAKHRENEKPIELSKNRIVSGALFTNDPSQATRVLTVLEVSRSR